MKICYFGIYNPDESRNRIYMRGFRQLGVDIIECRDNSRGFVKYFKLFKKHWKIRNDYDLMIVGYPGHSVVPLAKIISRKKVFFDALCSMYEGVVISRQKFSPFSLSAFYYKMIDLLAVRFADIILLETQNQKKYFENNFGQSSKYRVVYTGADDSIYHPDLNIKKRDKFTVVFRGKFLPEAGVKYVISAAKFLENENVDFLIIGNGWLEKEVIQQIEDLKPLNLEFVNKFVPDGELQRMMLSCHISLGQFENHERLMRTVPHKAYESLALGLPYVTARADGVSEILTDRVNCIMVNPSDPQDLARKILELRDDPSLVESLAEKGLELYKNKFTPKVLSEKILDSI